MTNTNNINKLTPQLDNCIESFSDKMYSIKKDIAHSLNEEMRTELRNTYHYGKWLRARRTTFLVTGKANELTSEIEEEWFIDRVMKLTLKKINL